MVNTQLSIIINFVLIFIALTLAWFERYTMAWGVIIVDIIFMFYALRKSRS